MPQVSSKQPPSGTSPGEAATSPDRTILSRPPARRPSAQPDEQHAAIVPQSASARVETHLGEILQGLFSTEQGPKRALVTAACPAFYSTATVEIRDRDDAIHTDPPARSKAASAVRRTMTYLGVEGLGAMVRVSSNIPTAIGGGGSTGDVVATIKATAMALGMPLSDDEAAYLAIEIEKASDPSMYPFDPRRMRLFRQRDGDTIEIFPGELPPLDVIAIIDGPPVDTLDYPPAQYSRRTLYEFDILRDGLRTALSFRDARRLGAVTTRSAEINQAFLPKPRFATWEHLAARYGAVGLAVSHSGSAVSFLFDGEDDRRLGRMAELHAELLRLLARVLVRYELRG